MSRQSLPTEGFTSFNPTGWHIPKKDRDKILAAIDIWNDEVTDSFLENIETAILMTLRRQELRVKSSDVKNAIKSAADAAANLVDALNKIPLTGRRFFQHADLSYKSALKRAEDTMQEILQADIKAETLLSGRGNEQSNNPWILAADIHQALVDIGIKPTYSRRKDTANFEKPGAGPFLLVADICFKLCQFPRADLHRYLKGACTGTRVNIERD